MSKNKVDRNFSVTIQRPEPEFTEATAHVNVLKFLRSKLGGDVKWFIFQTERGRDTDNLHLQMYIQLRRPARCRAVARMLGEGAHVESRHHSHGELRDYCSKEETRCPGTEGPWEEGTPCTGAGQRTDLDDLRITLAERPDAESAEPGRAPGLPPSVVRVSDEHFSCFIRHGRMIKEHIMLHTKKRNSFNTCIVYWGPTGTGKTTRANEEYGDAYWFSGSGNWYDGYDGEECIIFDDINPSIIPYNFMLQLCQQFQLRLPVKGSFVMCAATTIVVTSNLHPREWWPDRAWSPLERRLSITHMPGTGYATPPLCDMV